MKKQMKNETPYLTYGMGFEEDNRINDEEYFCGDVLNLGKEMEKEYPNDVLANLHRMFQIGFRCGIRSERNERIESEISMDDLAKSANDLYYLVIALDKYVFDNVSSTDVTSNSITGLNGIVQSMLLSAERHSKNISECNIKVFEV